MPPGSESLAASPFCQPRRGPAGVLGGGAAPPQQGETLTLAGGRVRAGSGAEDRGWSALNADVSPAAPRNQ